VTIPDHKRRGESDGSLVQSQETGALENGKGHDPDKVKAFLKKWAPKS
jgi:hypothetical protein